MSRAFSRPFLTLCAIGLVLGSLGLTNHEVWTADEPRVAAIGREMWEDRSLAVPRLSGEAFLEKPPLYWWAMVGIYEVTGRASPGAARATSALFSFATLLLAYALARRYFTREQSLLGALALLTCVLFVYRSHWIIVDSALMLGTTGALACFAWSQRREDAGATRGRGWLLAGMYAFLAIAFFTKGFIGIGIPGLGITVYLLWAGRLRGFLGWHVVLGGAAVLGLVALWLWQVYEDAGSEGLRAFLIHNHFGRLLPSQTEYTGGHERPIYYYFRQAPVDLLPFTPLLVLAFLLARRHWHALAGEEREGLRLFAAVWLSVFVALSLAGTKRGLYLLPIAPPAMLIAGWWMGSGLPRLPGEARFARGWWWFVGALGFLLAAVAFGIDPSRVAAGLLGLGFVSATAYAVHRLGARTEAARWLQVLAVLAAGWAVMLASGLAALDARKTLRPAAEAIAAHVPADARLYLFDPSETTRGIVMFYGGRRPVIVPGLEGLRELGAKGEPVWLLVEGKRGGGDITRLREAGIVHRPVASTSTSSRRELHLVVLGEGVKGG